MAQRLGRRTLSLILADAVVVMTAVLAALLVRLGISGAHSYLIEDEGLLRLLPIIIISLAFLYIYDLYDFVVISNRRELMLRAVQALGWSWLALALLYYFVPFLEIGRGTAVYSIAFSLLMLLGLRAAIHFLFGHPEFGEKVLIVGNGELAVDTARAISRRVDAGYRVAGFISSDFDGVKRSLPTARSLGSLDEMETIVERERINSIVINTQQLNGTFPTDALLRMRLAGGVNIEEFPSFFERVTARIHLGMFHPSWVIFSQRSPDTQLKAAFREIFYRFLALVSLVLSLPLIAITAVLVKLESKGPVFYRQTRVGKDGRLIEVIKFRSMRVDAEKDGSAIWAKKNDDRVTRVGRVIRKIRVDEIPQFWSILKGEMSFIGPRPERPQFVSMLAKEIPFYEHRHLVHPGLTGWAQIKYPYGSSVEDARRKLEYDLYYIKNQSIALDVVILFETVKTILFGRGAR